MDPPASLQHAQGMSGLEEAPYHLDPSNWNGEHSQKSSKNYSNEEAHHVTAVLRKVQETTAVEEIHMEVCLVARCLILFLKETLDLSPARQICLELGKESAFWF